LRHGKGHHKYKKVILLGNPNVGKSVIFGLLTGRYATVSNYPGTTVEISSGNAVIGDKEFLVIDSPGVNNLTPMSEDERVTRDLLLREKPEVIVLVGDAKNLKRALMLLIQLSEMELPCILDLNMEDEAKARGIEIDYEKLSGLLNIEVIGTVAPQKKGLSKLKEAILAPRIPSLQTNYGEVVERYIKEMSELLPDTGISKRSVALMLLSADVTFKEWLIVNLMPDTIKKIEDLRDEAQAKFTQPLDQKISHDRIMHAEEILNEVLIKGPPETGFFAQRLGTLTMHPVFGIPILLLVLFGFYQFVGKLGAGILVDFFEKVIFQTYLNPAVGKAIKAVIPVAFIQDMLVGQYGVFTMATMTTRILETNRERIIATFLIALTIPCSAQLGIIFGMLGTLPVRATLWWAGSITLILILSGYIASKILPGEKPDFFMELPPIRLPAMRNIIIKTLGRIEWYLKEAVPLFVLGTLILFLFDKVNILGWIETTASPIVVNLLGLPKKATAAFIIGFLRRDYGAAGMFDLARQGLLNENQVIVSLVTLTLFVPCLANLFMIIKERGIKAAVLMMVLIIPFALLVGGMLNFILH